MMGLGFLPQEINGMGNLLALVLDAKASKERFDALVQAASVHDRAAADAQKAQDEAQTKIDAATRSLADLSKAASDFEAKRAASEQTVNQRASDLDAKAAALSDQAKQLGALKGELGDKSAQLAKDGADAAKLREHLDAESASVAALKADYEARIEKIKSLAT